MHTSPLWEQRTGGVLELNKSVTQSREYHGGSEMRTGWVHVQLLPRLVRCGIALLLVLVLGAKGVRIPLIE